MYDISPPQYIDLVSFVGFRPAVRQIQQGVRQAVQDEPNRNSQRPSMTSCQIEFITV